MASRDCRTRFFVVAANQANVVANVEANVEEEVVVIVNMKGKGWGMRRETNSLALRVSLISIDTYCLTYTQ